MHSKNFFHRDIKPENILMTSTNIPKVCDFGFCWKISKTNESISDYVATWWYWSPELLLTDHYGKEVDIWALGCVAAELVDGQALFPGDDTVD